MISFPISLFLIPYAIIMAVIGFLGFIDLRNITRYRSEDMISFFSILIFLCGMIVIAFISYQYLLPMDWKEIVEINIFQKGFN